MLPKVPVEVENGGVYRQSVRCGKSNCRCAAGDLHQGYYYLMYRVAGRLCKKYVPRREVERISTLVSESRRLRSAERAERAKCRELLAEFRSQLLGARSAVDADDEVPRQNDK